MYRLHIIGPIEKEICFNIKDMFVWVAKCKIWIMKQKQLKLMY